MCKNHAFTPHKTDGGTSTMAAESQEARASLWKRDNHPCRLRECCTGTNK